MPSLGGLTVEEIARGFMVKPTAVGQRISRAKQRIDAAGRSFGPPPAPERGEHTDAILAELGYDADRIRDLHARSVV